MKWRGKVVSMFDPSELGSERIRRVSRAEYERRLEQGWFVNDRIELLRGVLVEMSPQHEPHARIAAWFAQHLSKVLAFERWDVRAHSPFAATADSMPEPDVSVAPRGRGHHQRGALLLIEVSDSSLRKDRVIKHEIYAEAGVPEYWIVDVKRKAVEVLTQPTATGYRHVERLTTGVLRPIKLRNVSFRIIDIPWRSRR